MAEDQKITRKSGKAKARRLQNQVVGALYGWFPHLKAGDIKPALMGEIGSDVKLSPLAKESIPFDIECKNQETIAIWKALEQAEKNTEPERIPLLVFTRNNTQTYACLPLEDLLELIEKTY